MILMKMTLWKSCNIDMFLR